jgi:hypothetical protein
MHYKEQSVMLFSGTVAAFPENQSDHRVFIMVRVTSGTPTKLMGRPVLTAVTIQFGILPIFRRRLLPPSSGLNRSRKKLMTAVPYFRLLLVSFSRREPFFNSRAVRVGLSDDGKYFCSRSSVFPANYEYYRTSTS